MQKLINKFLKLRGITTKNRSEKLDMTEEMIPSASLMKDAEKFINRVIELIQNKKRIVVYGDYDADGVFSTVLMVRALRDLSKFITGKEGKIHYFIPHRFKDGYGMKPKTIDKLRDKFPKTDVIITVDNGILAFDAIEHAQNLGIEVIVTDHHAGLPDKNPDCDIVVNPNRFDDNYPFKGISGTIVVYKLFLELAQTKVPELYNQYHSYVDFAGLSAITDVMPILYENRVYLKQALAIFNKESEHKRRFAWTAMIELLTSMKKMQKNHVINETDFGFTFGPMINAQSRVYGIADVAVDLFLSVKTEDVRSKVEFLFDTNETRKKVSDAAFIKAQEVDYTGQSSIVYVDETLGDGYIGLIAGRLAEKYHRPTIVFTKSEGVYKGSARAGLDINLIQALRKSEDLTVALGGHAGAAGLSVEIDEFEQFRTSITKTFEEVVPENVDTTRISDFDVTIDDLSYDLLDKFQDLAPFGEQFTAPVFKLNDLVIQDVKKMGSEKNHLKLICDGIDVIFWNGVSQVYDLAITATSVSVIGEVQVNEFLGRTSMQIIARSDADLQFK